MASYSPLRVHGLEHQDSENAILLPSKHFISELHTAEPPSKWPTWVALGFSVIAVACACTLYMASASISGWRDAHGLRKPNQYPGLGSTDELQEKQRGPTMYFPGAIVRVNKALPDQLYTSGSHVMLSGNDSMFYQWHLHRSKFTSCYIDSVVPTPDDGLVANKTYSSSGSLTEIQVWNVTTPAEPMRSLSWNTRPQRVALMGTVAFLPESEKIKQLQFEDGWQSRLPTRFSCGEKATITIEVACDGCRLEFEQLFSDPPLAFDLMQIG